MMPSVSKKQHNAMEAAAHGQSTLGIPKKVGAEFVAADEEDDRYTYKPGDLELFDKDGNPIDDPEEEIDPADVPEGETIHIYEDNA